MKTNLTPNVKRAIAQHIVRQLERQQFSRWYNKGSFDAFISGDTDAPKRQEIEAVVEEMFLPDEVQ